MNYEFLNLFYDEPDPDRWLPGDRYPRRFLRQLIHGPAKVGGQRRVFLNLCAGLDRLGISYRVNDYRHLRAHRDETACVVGKPCVLDRMHNGNPIVFGSAVFSHPLGDPQLCQRLPIRRVLVPGPWMQRMFEPFYGDRVQVWPTGIDTDYWSPDPTVEKTIDVLIYDKVCWEHDRYERELIDPLAMEMNRRGLRHTTVRYGSYSEPEFRNLLRQSRWMLFLCEHETQGFAYQEALATGVPILAWDRGGCWQDPEYFPDRVRFEPVSSVPYWSDECGERFVSLDDFDSQLDRFQARLNCDDFAPREFILKHLTLEQCARHYVELVGQSATIPHSFASPPPRHESIDECAQHVTETPPPALRAARATAENEVSHIRSRHRIVILTGSHLCHNPRAVKEADALAAAGYQVEVLIAWSIDELAARDEKLLATRPWKATLVADLRNTSVAGMIRRCWISLQRFAAQTMFKLFCRESRRQLGGTSDALLRTALTRRASLFIAHSEPAMWAATKLIGRGVKVGIDFEDWYSEDLLPLARKARPLRLLRAWERRLLLDAAYRACPSEAMSSALSLAYEAAPPEVVYNVFPFADRKCLDGQSKDRKNRSRLSIHWFSQTLGVGRGLENLLAALPLLDQPVELHLRGQPHADWPQLLADNCRPEFRSSVFTHPIVSNDELLSRIAEHDIGYAGESSEPASRDLTITNKVFQYLLAGLPVVASDTTGQREAARLAPGAIALYEPGNVVALAAALNRLLNDPQGRANAQQAAVAASESTLCWETQQVRVVQQVDQAVLGASIDLHQAMR